jgi:uncharacterized DUF497 family protein
MPAVRLPAMLPKGTHRAELCPVKYFTWGAAKNEKLRAERGISFEEIVYHIERGDLLDILENRNQKRYAGQRVSSSTFKTMPTWCRSRSRKPRFSSRRSSRVERRPKNT